MRNSQHASRIWWFRLLALAIGLLPFFLCEFVLRLAGIPKQPAAVDPYVDLGLLRPLFEYDDATGQYQIAASRYNLFQPVSFAAEKSDRLFRVFALGGSTTQGEPYGTATAFPKWMELELQARMPDFQVEVINCGGLSYASYRVKVILSEVLAYQPDLVVVYTGHNEYLEERTYDGFRSRAGWFGLDSLQELHTVQWVRALVAGPAGRADPLVRSPTQM
ncbi:MAG: hypothetical protein KDB22_22310, partial [Planctomycetales bacterium]|nr:hypothetical protein [Planctomycetales bacterium]